MKQGLRSIKNLLDLGLIAFSCLQTGTFKEQTLQAHIDLKGRHLLPVHNGTFDLALHAWDDPFERIVALAQKNNLAISTPQMGELLNLNEPNVENYWWRS